MKVRKIAEGFVSGMGKANIVGEMLNAKVFGLMQVFHIEKVTGYLDPYYVDGWTYNPADHNWYFFAAGEWLKQADPESSQAYDLVRKFRLEHNERERLYPTKEATEQHRVIYKKALEHQPRRDPLALDLDGDGIETLPITSSVKFDFEGKGVRTATGWVGPDDGFLVLDRNGDGKIGSGSELFGIDTVKKNGTFAKDGFDALKDLDSNGDNFFNVLDESFDNAFVWSDKNSDGISQSSELMSLVELGIVSVNLTARKTSLDSNGNIISAIGEFATVDGELLESSANFSMVVNLDLVKDGYRSEFAEALPVLEEVSALPNFAGSGHVRSLHEAASVSVAVRELLVEISEESTRSGQKALVDSLLAEWAATSVSPTKDVYEKIKASLPLGLELFIDWEGRDELLTFFERIAVLEAFNGEDLINFKVEGSTGSTLTLQMYVGANLSEAVFSVEDNKIFLELDRFSFDSGQVELIEQAYGKLSESVFNSVSIQTRMVEYIYEVDVSISNGEVVASFGSVVDKLRLLYEDSVDAAIETLSELFIFLPAGGQAWLSLANEWGVGTRGTELADYASVVTELYWAGAGDDLISTANTSGSVIDGGDGNDNITGSIGNDFLHGGAGNDTLTGGEGNDTYLFLRGGGKDTIHQRDNYGREIVLFGNDISFQDVDISKAGNALLVKIKGTEDELVIHGYFKSGNLGGSVSLVFFDHSLSEETVRNIVLAPSEGKTIIEGFDTEDEISGGEQGENIYGLDGDDSLFGGAGDDLLFGGEGDDILDGGMGNDELQGGGGSDVYIFGRGSGKDVIVGYSDPGDIDVVRLAVGVNRDHVSFSRDFGSIYIKINGSEDQLTIGSAYDWGGELTPSVDEIVFGNGEHLSIKDVTLQLSQGGSSDDVLYGDLAENVLDGGEGNNRVYGGYGNDTLKGGGGVDYLYGEYGDDILVGGRNLDYLYGGEGSDLYLYSRGDGGSQIDNSDLDPVSIDAVKFTDISSSEAYFYRSSNDLVIAVKDDWAGSVRVLDHFLSGASYKEIDYIEFSDQVRVDKKRISELVLIGSEASDQMDGSDQGEYLRGNGGADTINAGAGDDTIDGGDGDDLIQSGDGDDTLIGGAGNDNLWGGQGTDTFVLQINGGHDSIGSAEPLDHGPDWIYIDKDIDKSQVLVSLQLGLTISIADTGNAITLLGNFDSADALGAKIFGLKFNDGTVWSPAALMAKANLASQYGDYLFGTELDDEIHGLSGDDKIYGRSGNDALYGDEGSDALYGGEGDDILVGGSGDDSYYDALGSNLYEIGAGNDVVYENSKDTRLLIKEGEYDDLRYARAGNDLVISRSEESRLTLKNYFQYFEDASYYSLTIITSAGELVLGLSDVQVLVNVHRGGAGNDRIEMGAENNTVYGGEGDDVILGGAGDDILIGESGKDYLAGGFGNDLLVGGIGDDGFSGDEGQNIIQYSLGDGNDVLYAGAGRDTIQFLSGIVLESVDFYRYQDDLVITVDGSAGSISLPEYFNNIGNHSFGGVGFADGGTISSAEINGLVKAADPWFKYPEENTFLGTSDNEMIFGTQFNDFLFGRGGQDSIYGGMGDDTYYFISGELMISESGGVDSLIMPEKSGMTMMPSRFQNDLVLGFSDSVNDKIIISNFFSGPSNLVESLVLRDGFANSEVILGYFGAGSTPPIEPAPQPYPDPDFPPVV